MASTALSPTTLLAAATLLLLFHPAAGLSARPARTSLESADVITLTRAPGEPPFSKSARYGCHFTRRGQFSIVLPQKGYKHGGVFVNVSATVLSGDTLRCDKPVGAVTAGNTTVCVHALDAIPPRGKQRKAVYGVPNCLALGPYGETNTEHFATFAPAFSRRPYIRETEGALLVRLDASLAGHPLKLTATLNLNGTTHSPILVQHFAAGSDPTATLRFPFDLTKMPPMVTADAEIILTDLAAQRSYRHTRAFHRSPLPPAGTVTLQVDHEHQGALLKDGVRFAMEGWFAGGYNGESAGLPPWEIVGRDAGVDLAVLGQASLVTEWGRHGQTFVRAGGWAQNKTETFQFLDAAAAAGMSVLWNLEIDRMAMAMAGIADAKNRTGFPGDPKALWAEIAGNITEVRGHPAIGGYYACDDCCHMSDLDTYGPKEYEALATIKGMVREIDPWHLMFGTIACGEPWYWSEEGAGLGMDVMMKEGYGGGLTAGAHQCRVFPMTYETLVQMPDPEALGSMHGLRTKAYTQALTATMLHTNFFVENPGQWNEFQQGFAVSVISAEFIELLPSLSSSLTPVEVSASEGVIARLFTEENPAGECLHVIASNTMDLPMPLVVEVPALGGRLATRLFGGPYALNFTADGTLNDFIDSRGTNVYRVGCNFSGGGAASGNIISNGDFEETSASLGSPGHFSGRGMVGSCATPAGGTPSFRCRVTADTADPHGGRYSAKINLGTEGAGITLPVTAAALTSGRVEYELTAWVRSSPAGVRVGATVNGTAVPGAVFVAGAGAWTQMVVRVPLLYNATTPPTPPLPLGLTFVHEVAPAGGAMWVDDVFMRKL